MAGYNGAPGWYVPTTNMQPPPQNVRRNAGMAPQEMYPPTFSLYNTYYTRPNEQNMPSQPETPAPVWTPRPEPQPQFRPTPTFSYGHPNVSNEVPRTQVRQPPAAAVQHFQQPITNYTWNTGPASGVSYDLPRGMFPALLHPTPIIRRHEFVNSPEYVNRGFYQHPHAVYGAGGYASQPPVYTHGGNVWNVGTPPTTSNGNIPMRTLHQNIYAFGQPNSTFPAMIYPPHIPILGSNAATFQPNVVVTSVPVHVHMPDIWNTNTGINVPQPCQLDSGNWLNVPSSQPIAASSGLQQQQTPVNTTANDPPKLTTLTEGLGFDRCSINSIPNSSESNIRTEGSDCKGEKKESGVIVIRGACGRTIGTVDKTTHQFHANIDINEIWKPIAEQEAPRKPMKLNPTFVTNMEPEPELPIVKPCLWSFVYRFPPEENMETASAPVDLIASFDKESQPTAQSTPIQKTKKTPLAKDTSETPIQTYAQVATTKVIPAASVVQQGKEPAASKTQPEKKATASKTQPEKKATASKMQPETAPTLPLKPDVLGPIFGRPSSSSTDVKAFPPLLNGIRNGTKPKKTWTPGIGEWCKEQTRKEENQQNGTHLVQETPAAILFFNVPNTMQAHTMFKLCKHYGALYRVSAFINRKQKMVFGVFFEQDYLAKKAATGLDGIYLYGKKADLELVTASNKDTLDNKVKVVRRLKVEFSVAYKHKDYR